MPSGFELTVIVMILVAILGPGIWRMVYGYRCRSCNGARMKWMDRQQIGKWRWVNGTPVPDATQWWQCPACGESWFCIRGRDWSQEKMALLRRSLPGRVLSSTRTHGRLDATATREDGDTEL